MAGESECGELVRSIDWSKTPLGAVTSWSVALKTAVSFVLSSRYPMVLFWGPERVQLYNDAFVPNLGDGQHPAAMGRRAGDARASDDAASSIFIARTDEVMRHGEPVGREDELIPIRRDGRLEEAYWSYSFSPVYEHDGSVGGVLALWMETTTRVIAARRARTLRAFADRIASVTATSDLTRAAIEALSEAPEDVPFVACYELAPDGRLRDFRSPTTDVELLRVVREAVETCRVVPFSGCVVPLAPLEDRAEGRAYPREAFVVPLPVNDWSAPELVVFGLNPRRPFNGAYREHLTELVERLARARTRIETIEARANAESERRNLLLQTPAATAMLEGPELVFELANQAFLELVQRDVIGKRFEDAFPEAVNAEVHRLLERAYTTGERLSRAEQLAPMARNGVVEERWFAIQVQPTRNRSGEVSGLVVIWSEVTEAVVARRTLEQYALERERLLEKAEAASRSKDEFLAMLGHELRNPLAPITTALHLMKMKAPNALTREREIIERQAAHLVKLVDDLLDVSRVARGKVTLHMSHVALSDVIARAVEIASPLFEKKQHVLTLDGDRSEPIHLVGDPLRLAQVFANLLTNAAKYTSPGGRVSLRVRREGDAAVVRIEDNGAGLQPDQIPHLFDAFFQGRRTMEQAQGGLGLGLALVKSFVTMHGGSVQAWSEGPGKGSTFEVQLPALPHDRATVPANVQLQAEPPPSVKRRVLLVDDSEDILEIVSSLLRCEGYEVRAALDGPTALQLAASFRPEVAVLDIGLPAMDGYELAQHLRELLGDEAPKLVAMTGYGQSADRERARKAGFAVHLVKPVDPAQLLASVAT
jgi:signal transduction histidine kinase